jgi:hypothetical protein
MAKVWNFEVMPDGFNVDEMCIEIAYIIPQNSLFSERHK